MDQSITLSIEPTVGPTYQHGFHLGTDLELAKTIAAEMFVANAKIWRTVALKQGGHIVDYFDGEWSNDRDF